MRSDSDRASHDDPYILEIKILFFQIRAIQVRAEAAGIDSGGGHELQQLKVLTADSRIKKF